MRMRCVICFNHRACLFGVRPRDLMRQFHARGARIREVREHVLFVANALRRQHRDQRLEHRAVDQRLGSEAR